MINVAELDERIDRCLAILADNPHSQVFAALAEAYRRRGEFGRAFSVCKSGLKHHSDYGPAYVVLAKLYLHQKMLPDALSSLKRAVELDGPTRVTDLLEAEVQVALGDVTAAQTVINRLRVTDPGNPALPELMEQVRRSRSGPAASPVADPIDQTPQHQPRMRPDTRPVPDCVDWQGWVQVLGALQALMWCSYSMIATESLHAIPNQRRRGRRSIPFCPCYRNCQPSFPGQYGGLSVSYGSKLAVVTCG